MCALQKVIEDLISQPVEEGTNSTDVFHILEALSEVNLWPLSKRLQTSTLRAVLKDLRRFPRCPGNMDCSCDTYEFDNALEMAAKDVERELKGLCLTCFKKGRATWEEDNCSDGSCLDME